MGVGGTVQDGDLSDWHRSSAGWTYHFSNPLCLSQPARLLRWFDAPPPSSKGRKLWFPLLVGESQQRQQQRLTCTHRPEVSTARRIYMNMSEKRFILGSRFWPWLNKDRDSLLLRGVNKSNYQRSSVISLRVH